MRHVFWDDEEDRVRAGWRVLAQLVALPIGLHIAWNFVQGNVFGFPVSGSGYSVGTFIGTQQVGPALWTGGPFGPEAGLLGIGAALLGSALILLWVRLWRGSAGLARGISQAPEATASVAQRGLEARTEAGRA